jgi:hypothetical protein
MPINRVRTRLLVQCMTDAKLNNLEIYAHQLNVPDSWVRVFINSVSEVMDKELKNLAKRMNKNIDKKIAGHWHQKENQNA